MNVTSISLSEMKIEYFIIKWQSEMQAMQSATKSEQNQMQKRKVIDVYIVEN